MFYIESRWPAWARWRPVTARLHDERNAFNPETRVLQFTTREAAEYACAEMAKANAGEYRVISA